MPDDLTLIINLSAGDAAYAHLTAGALANAHRQLAKEIIIILDDTKAQHSNFYNHKKRYNEPEYTEKLKKVTETAQSLKQAGLVDEVIMLNHYSTQKNLNKKYLNNRVKETHDFRGAPITAYLAGFEACKTQYLVRYDGDMLLHQTTIDWVIKGIDVLKQHRDCVAVSPRPSPPTSHQNIPDLDSVYWFSTRCTLFDMKKLIYTIPFFSKDYFIEVWLRRWFNKTYPPAFETILCKCLKKRKLKNYYLLKQGSWLLHPEEKNELFVALLPMIITEIGRGNHPMEQVDCETLDLKAWEKYLKPISV